MDLNKVKNNFKYIIIAVIVIILAVSLFLYLVGKNKNSQSVKSLNIKNISATQYYVKKNPTFFSGFTISSIGTTIFVNITKSPCTQYRSEAIKYLNEFKKTNTPLSVKFIIQGNSLNVPLSCFKSYTLK
jgi:hypothetical protein